MKIILNILTWIISVTFQIVTGFVVGYIFFAEGYGNILFLWIGITLGVFLVGILGTILRKTISPKRYFLRLGLTALGVSLPFVVFYRTDLFFYNADYEIFPLVPFLAIAIGIMGFYVSDKFMRGDSYKKIINTIGYSVSTLVLVSGVYVLWDWFTPFRLPIQNLKPNQALNMELVNIVGDGFNPEVIRENYVYGIANNRLAVFDISDLNHMFPVGQSEIISDDLIRINLFQNYAYITSGSFGSNTENKIYVVDIANPTHPHYLASYTLSGKYIWKVKNFKSYFFIIGCVECTQYSYDQHALYILDLNDPSKPVEIGHYYSDTNISDMAFYGDYAYLALAEDGHEHDGLRILNIENPKEPKDATSLFPSGEGYQVTISNNKLYFDGKSKDFANGLYIMDISSPTIPKEISFHSHSDYNELNILSNDIGYTTKTTPCICVVSDETLKTVVTFIDYSNPKQPKQRGTFEFEGFSVDIQGSLAIAWDSVTQADRFFDISNLDNPMEVGRYIPFNLHDLTGEIFIDGTKAVIPTDKTKLYILDISNPSLPILAGVYDVGDDEYSIIKFYRNYVYLNISNEIQVLDISNTVNPSIVWRYNMIDQSRQYAGMAITGDHALMISEMDGLYIYDISDSANPILINHQKDLKGFGYIDGFDSIGEHFYTYNNRKLYAFDLSDPKNVYETDSLKTSTYQNVTVIGKLAFLDNSPFVGNEPATLSIVDLSNPQKLKLVSSYNWLQWSSISGNSENMIYIADWSDGLHIVDFSDPKNPKEIGFYGIKDGAKGIAVGKGNFVYVLSDNNYDLYILRYIPTAP